MSAEIIVAIISAFVTLLALIGSNYFTKRSQLKFEERKLKEEYYTMFIKAVSDSAVLNHTNKSKDALSDSFNKLLLVGTPEVVNSLMAFHECVKQSNNTFSVEEHDKLLTALLLDMRKDLFTDKKVNNGYPIIHLTGNSRGKTTGGN